MGGVDIIVPPDLRVEVTGFGLMGGWDDKTRDEDLPPDAPLVQVRAFTLMGGVTVKSKERKSTQGGR